MDKSESWFTASSRIALTYINTYPQIVDKTLLCKYYRKYNKSARITFIIFCLAIFVAEFIRLVSAIINGESWAYWQKILLIWLAMDSGFFIIVYSCVAVVRAGDEEKNKWDLAYQTNARNKLQLCSFLPTVVLAVVPFMLPGIENAVETTSVIWLILSLVELHFCVWTIDGIAYKSLMMILFNSGFCGTAIWKGLFVAKHVPKFIVPVILAISFFVFFDRQSKLNFILKQTLKQQKNMYEKHLEKVQDPVLILDHTQLLFCNNAAKLTIAKNYAEFWDRAGYIVAESGESLGEMVRRKLSSVGGTAVIQQKYFMHDVDSDVISYTRIMLVTTIDSTFFAKQKIVSVAFHDATEELKQEENRIEEKYKNMLLFSLSHELRTPLNIFQAFLTTSKKLLKARPDYEMHKNAKGAWRYLRNKISDILDYAQIVAEKFVLHKAQFSLRGFVHRLQKITHCLLANKREAIKLNFAIDSTVNDRFFGDRDRLEQVLFNLLSNAVKYTTAGTISLHVFPSTQESEQLLVFEVSDTGCGMSSSDVSSLFELKSKKIQDRLEDHDASYHGKKSTKLSGLGLTVSKMICNHMGCGIRVKSEPGKGSSFFFGFPAVTTMAQQESKSWQDEGSILKEDVAVSSCGHWTGLYTSNLGCLPLPKKYYSNRSSPIIEARPLVLIVDDNELNRFVVKGMIVKMGFRTVEADNGKAAIDMLDAMQKESPKAEIVIFMDIDMPVMDGIEATVRIRGKKERESQPQIIALTAFASEEERKKCMDVGMNGFISKPLTKENLVDLFNNLKLAN